jgi:hypothetical protein
MYFLTNRKKDNPNKSLDNCTTRGWELYVLVSLNMRTRSNEIIFFSRRY